MSNLTIFKNAGDLANTPLRSSNLGKQIADTMGGFNRIQTNTNGTFKRIVNGEQVGKAIRGEFNAIIVAMLAKPGRSYYATDYDPDAKPTLPDCFSNLGDKPEERVADRQASNCANCPKNVDGSGKNGKGKACRFQRKVALLLEGDETGEVYQFQIPAKSLFGKGNGNTHPFESYCRYLVANGAAPDTVVTTIAYNLDAETMELNFTPVRPVSDEEFELIERAQTNPATQRLIQLTVAEADGAKPATKAKAKPVVEDDEDDEEEEAPAPIKKAKPPVVQDDEDEDDIPAPKAKPKAKKEEPAKITQDLAAILDAWADDEDED
jgi:hypothetical protein